MFFILSFIVIGTALADQHDTDENDKKEEVKKCESWKKERGNKYAKVPGSRLVCVDKENG